MFNREKATASIHFKDDTIGLCPYTVIVKDSESPAQEFGAFSNYDSARYFATTNAANIVLDCGRADHCAKCYTVRPLIDVDAEDFSRVFWNGETWQKPEHVKFVRRICRQCCRD